MSQYKSFWIYESSFVKHNSGNAIPFIRPNSMWLFLISQTENLSQKQDLRAWRALKNKQNSLTPYQKMSLRGTSTNGKLTGIIVLNAKWNILKRINISFIVYFCLSKYSLSTNTLRSKSNCGDSSGSC